MSPRNMLIVVFTLGVLFFGTYAFGAGESGLWVGRVTLDKVSGLTSGGGLEDASASLPMNVILHVDESGTTRLLKEVILMFDPSGDPDNPGTFVLVTDDARIHAFEGVAFQDGQSVGRRMSAVGYDFDDAEQTHRNTMSASSGSLQSGSVVFDLSLPADYPTNPFFHRYHPDHDESGESSAVNRHIIMTFDSLWSGESTAMPPGWGETFRQGTYSEEITGIHKEIIVISGRFDLNRVTEVATLNQ